MYYSIFSQVIIVEKLMPIETYGKKLEGAQVEGEVLWRWLVGFERKRFGLEKIAEWVGIMENFSNPNEPAMPPMTTVTISWFMSIFVGLLDVQTTLRVWDVFLM